MVSLRIIGLVPEEYSQVYLEGTNCRFEKRTRPATRYYLYAEDPDTGDFWKITLDENYEEECHSGWTTATYGFMERELVSTLPTLTHVPKVETTLEVDFDSHDYKCDLFSYSLEGRDHYYPNGHVEIFWDNFTPAP